MNEKYVFNQITKTLEKLFEAGFNTDKKIMSIKLEDLDKIPNLQGNEALIILSFKRAVKNKEIILFLSGNYPTSEKEVELLWVIAKENHQ